MISMELLLWLVDHGDGNPNVCVVTVTTRVIPVENQAICRQESVRILVCRSDGERGKMETNRVLLLSDQSASTASSNAGPPPLRDVPVSSQ
jgi:hypothetical protein